MQNRFSRASSQSAALGPPGNLHVRQLGFGHELGLAWDVIPLPLSGLGRPGNSDLVGQKSGATPGESHTDSMGDEITAPPSSSIPFQNAFHRHLSLPQTTAKPFLREQNAGAFLPLLRCSCRRFSSCLQRPTHQVRPLLRRQLLSLRSSSRSPDLARKVFDVTPRSDVVSCSALISNYVRSGLTRETLLAFNNMQSLGIRNNKFTLPTLLEAYSDFIAGTQIHAVVIITVFDSDVFVANTLIVMYAGLGGFVSLL